MLSDLKRLNDDYIGGIRLDDFMKLIEEDLKNCEVSFYPEYSGGEYIKTDDAKRIYKLLHIEFFKIGTDNL